ncbi:MarR family transcriptional regulator [Phytomonospora endophytica]|uniref:DNA-binding MarR family transcriptional regulator n=1 Tax=Phytomonospora endophytica TaxID=714109 RepID=A0A841FSQ4_9ACTN|nr:MarR family transcriptional regulator [Phytomonospora endophytica]MBB6039305.1 DNA-binding MarR family transcriptional regulator [Phytomonospora endophytica]GIG69753.1 MarR family transcriptional regulator [Phytomonospora endophytica]
MSSVVNTEGARAHRRASAAVRESLRGLAVQLSLLNQGVGGRLELKGTDVGCLDLVNRLGPLSPTALAKAAGMHPATMTGVLDRLEKGGWVARERDEADRRAVKIRARKDRNGEVLQAYAGMNTAMEELCAGYGVEELELINDFIRRTATAGQGAAEELRAG